MTTGLNGLGIVIEKCILKYRLYTVWLATTMVIESK